MPVVQVCPGDQVRSVVATSTVVREGIQRGGIWTAAELRDLASLDRRTRPEFTRLARLKAAFGAEIVGIVGGDEAPQHA